MYVEMHHVCAFAVASSIGPTDYPLLHVSCNQKRILILKSSAYLSAYTLNFESVHVFECMNVFYINKHSIDQQCIIKNEC